MKKMLITGGQGDIAQAIAERYKDEYELYLPSSKELDVTDKNSVKEYIKDLEFDVLINNAGTIHPKRILESDEALWERDINVNLIGPYLVSKTILENNSACLIVNVSSTAAFNSYSDWSSYCSSKAALVTFTKCLSNDGFKAFVLCPGAILTKFRIGLGLSNDNAMATEKVIEQIDKTIKEEYQPGDIIFFRKDEFKVNPKL